MAFKKMDPVIVLLTKELADEFWTMPRCFCERLISPSRLRLLTEELRNGPRLTFQWAKAVCGNNVFRINGQCSSKIYSEGILPIPESGRVLLETFICDTLADVASAWDAYDAKFVVRTPADVIRAWFSTEPTFKTVSFDDARAAVAGVRIVKDGCNGQMTGDELGRLVVDNRDFIVFYSSIVAGEGLMTNGAVVMKSAMKRAPVVGAMYLTAQRDGVASRNFWLAVRNGEGSSPTDPPRVLREYLLTTTVAGASRIATRADTRPAMLEKCLRAWNAWRERRDLRVLKSLGTIPEIV